MKLPQIPLLNKKAGSKKELEFLTASADSKSAKIYLFRLFDEDKVELLSVGEHQFEGRPAVSFGEVVDENALQEAFEFALKRCLGKSPEQKYPVIVGSYGNSAIYFSTTARVKRPDPDKEVARKEVLEVVQKIEEKAITKAQNLLQVQRGVDQGEAVLTDSAFVFIKSDGNLILKESGFTGERLEVELFTAFSTEEYTKAMRKVFKGLGQEFLAVSSEAYAYMQATNPQVASEEEGNFILVNLKSDVTEVSVVFGGGPKESLSFGIGSLDLLNVEENMEPWLLSLDALLGDFEGVKTFPNEIHLIGEGLATNPEIKIQVENYSWLRYHPFKQPPRVIYPAFSNLEKISVPADRAVLKDFTPICLGGLIFEHYG